MFDLPPFAAAAAIVLAAVIAHGAVALARYRGLRALTGKDVRTSYKARTVVSLIASSLEFVIWFVAFGLVLLQFGVSLTAYLAGASVLGLAVAFGSQGLVQDVVSGVTILIADLFNVGEMIEAAGQVGVVEALGIRYTTLRNAQGGLVQIPNRNITHVVKYPRRHVRCHVDIVLPGNARKADRLAKVCETQVAAAVEQWPAVFIRPPSVARKAFLGGERAVLRITFRIWPGRGGIVEGPFQKELVNRLKAADDKFVDWMATVNYEVETRNVSSDPLARARDLLGMAMHQPSPASPPPPEPKDTPSARQSQRRHRSSPRVSRRRRPPRR